MVDAVLHVRVVSPEAVLLDREATGLVIPAWDGKIGVLPGHAPLIALLGEGELVVRLAAGGKENMYVRRGVVRVEGEQVTVLSEAASREVPPGAEGTSVWIDLEGPDVLAGPEDLEAISGPESPLV